MGHARLTDQNHSTNWPDYLKKANKESRKPSLETTPVVVEMSKPNAETALKKLVTTNPIIEINDSYDEQLAELYLSQHAHLYRANSGVQKNSIKDFLKEHYGSSEAWKLGSWVYYPWSGRLIHVIERELFNNLRTIRNRDLINYDEQLKLANFNVACLGMSVWSSSALALILSGISDKIKLADGAVISGSNLNRILTGVSSVGFEKTLVIQQKLYEMNPYIEVSSLKGKLTLENIAQLFDSPWPVHLIIDEIDDLEMKIRVRVEARKRRVPVIMATELGDSVMLDVERFDLDDNLPLFHGIAGNIEEILNKKDMTQRQWMKYATTIIGPKNVPLNMQKSLLKIGTTVVTHPQLGATAMMTGGVLAFAAKQIALGKNLPSMRKNLSLERAFLPDHRTFKHRRQHSKHTKVLRRSLDAM
jgi:hypothetical protein